MSTAPPGADSGRASFDPQTPIHTSALDLDAASLRRSSSSSAQRSRDGTRRSHDAHPAKPGALSKLVGRFRSVSTGTSASEASTPTVNRSGANSPAASDSESARSGHRTRTHGFKFSSVKAHPTPDVTGGTSIAGERPHGRKESAASHAHARDAATSLDLWNEAYDSLRDSPRTRGLVFAYEGIVCQELPDHLKVGGLNTTLRAHPDSMRLELVSVIAESGLRKRRSSKTSQIRDEARAMVSVTKHSIASLINAYPSAALAWCGLCTLTPLLMDPIILNADMWQGLLHITGRISWYMHLSRLLIHESWLDVAEYRSSRDRVQQSITTLYRKVLEFEMNCVCAPASTWSTAAKNVVDSHGLGDLATEIEQLDTDLIAVVSQNASESIRGRLLADYRNLEI